MPATDYHKRIVDYYRETENAYKDSWDLDRSLAIHYGYRDEKARSFRASLGRMNEVMAEAAAIREAEQVLDAGCGIGGAAIFLAGTYGCRVQGITLSQRQVALASSNAREHGVASLVSFREDDYCHTSFPADSFDVVWACESVCYAHDKTQFISEAFRLLKPGGRLVVADGFVSDYRNNDHPFVRKWLDGWQVNYLESPRRFCEAMESAGFRDIEYRDITSQTSHSSRRLYRYYYLASMYLAWKKITWSKPPSALQKGNIAACKYQYHAMKKALWQYGLVVCRKN